MHSLNVITQSGCYDEAGGRNEVSTSSLIGILLFDGVSDDISEGEFAKFEVWISSQNYRNLFICKTKMKKITALYYFANKHMGRVYYHLIRWV